MRGASLRRAARSASLGVPGASLGAHGASLGVAEANLGVPGASLGVAEANLGVAEAILMHLAVLWTNPRRLIFQDSSQRDVATSKASRAPNALFDRRKKSATIPRATEKP